jgi:hypothetical protein
MIKARFVAVLAALLFAGTLAAQKQGQAPSKKDLQPEEIIKAFTTKESEFFDVWTQYYYRQVASIHVLAVDGAPSKEALTLVFEVVFNDNGTREVKLIERTGRLTNVMWTADDEDVITNFQPFALTSSDLPNYDLKYEGKERVDELDTYVFSVKPKSTKGDKLYFEGKIWVDNVDLQIVRTVGKVVPQPDPNVQFPAFETLRQLVDKKYWFPVWSHADSTLKFPDKNVHIEETITYEGFKRFSSSVIIKPIKK